MKKNGSKLQGTKVHRNRQKTIEELLEDGTEIDNAIKAAVRYALLQHKRAGNPVAVWEDGKVTWIAPEEIPFDDAVEQQG